jgi:hypothetical protein
MNFTPSRQFPGFISNFRLTKSAVYTSTFTPSTTPLTVLANTTALLTFSTQGRFNNGQFLDLTKNSFTNTSVNSPVYSGLSPFGNTYPGSISFTRASSQSLVVATNAAFTYATGDFTIETWVNFRTTGTTQYFIDQRNASGANAIIPTLYINSSGNIRYYVAGADRISGTQTLTAGTWYHVAICRSGTSTKLFINGTQDGSTFTDTYNYAASRVTLGVAGDISLSYLDGYLSNVRLTKGQALYTTTFTPSTTPLGITSNTVTSLLIRGQEGGFYDLSNYGQQISTTASALISTQQKKFGAQAASFVATNYETVINSSSLQFTGAFTIEGWVYRNAAGATHTLMSKGAATPTGWMLQINSSNQLTWTSSSTVLRTSTTTISATTWTYFAISRDGSGNTYMFINGTLQSTSFTDATSYTETNNLFIGCDRSNANGLNGYLDDVRITNGVGRYTTSFTAPTTTFPTS